MYNLKDSQRRAKQEKVIERLKDEHAKNQKDEIFEDDVDEQNDAKFNEMRETKTGFGAKGQHYQQEGGLEPDDEDSDEDEGEDDDQDIGDDGEEDDDESDHNF